MDKLGAQNQEMTQIVPLLFGHNLSPEAPTVITSELCARQLAEMRAEKKQYGVFKQELRRMQRQLQGGEKTCADGRRDPGAAQAQGGVYVAAHRGRVHPVQVSGVRHGG